MKKKLDLNQLAKSIVEQAAGEVAPKKEPEKKKTAQIEATQWLWCYNNNRPHMSLGGFTPAQTRMMALTNSRVLH